MNKQLNKEIFSFQSRQGLNNYIGIIPNPDKILNQSNTFSNLRELKNDPHLWSCVQSRKSGSLLSKLNFDKTDNEEIDYILELLLNNLDEYKFKSYILDAILYGYQPIEIIWKKVDNKYTLDYISAKPQEWFKYSYESKLKYINDNNEEIDIEKYKILCPQFEPSFNNPYGESLLSKCYWMVNFKRGAIRFWVNLMEKYGFPIFIGKYTRGATAEEISGLVEVLNNLYQDTVIVTPSDINLEIKDPNKESSSELFISMIDYCNKEISKIILSQNLTTEISNTSSFGAAKVHNQVRNEIIESDLQLIISMYEILAKWTLEINGYYNIKVKVNIE